MWDNYPVVAILWCDQRRVSAGIHCTDPQVKTLFRTLCRIYITPWQMNGFVSLWTTWNQIRTLMDFSLQCECDKFITSERLEWYYEECLQILIWTLCCMSCKHSKKQKKVNTTCHNVLSVDAASLVKEIIWLDLEAEFGAYICILLRRKNWPLINCKHWKKIDPGYSWNLLYGWNEDKYWLLC